MGSWGYSHWIFSTQFDDFVPEEWGPDFLEASADSLIEFLAHILSVS